MTTLEVLNERPFELYVTGLFHSVALAISPNIVLSAAFVPTLGAACKQDNLRLTGVLDQLPFEYLDLRAGSDQSNFLI
jgi:hypothetical protein